MSDRIPLYQIGEAVTVLPATDKFFHTKKMKNMIGNSFVVEVVDNSYGEEYVWYRLNGDWFPEFELTSSVKIQEITSEEVTDILENG